MRLPWAYAQANCYRYSVAGDELVKSTRCGHDPMIDGAATWLRYPQEHDSRARRFNIGSLHPKPLRAAIDRSCGCRSSKPQEAISSCELSDIVSPSNHFVMD